MRLRHFALFISTLCSVSLALAEPAMEPGCSEVNMVESPFKIVKPVGGKDRLATDWSGKLRGYLPANSIVEFTGTNLIDSQHSALGYVGVKVLSVPKNENAQVVLAPRNTRQHPKDIGAASSINLVGSVGYVDRRDLVPYVPGVLTTATELVGKTPGFEDAGSTVFVVRKSSPLYSVPGLAGRAVRLARTNDGAYRMKRCCPNGVPQDGVLNRTRNWLGSWTSGTVIERARRPGCDYQPVFQVLNGGSTANPSVEREYAPPQNCNGFTSLLQPTSEQSIQSAVNALAGPARTSEEFQARLQRAATENVMESRCNSAGHCESGNHSKSLCRSGARDTLADLGLLPKNWKPNPDPRLAATNFDGQLEQFNFRKIPVRKTPAGYDAEHAPIGAVIIYEGGTYGHIEIKVGPHMYCSDYCTDHPRDTSGGRTVKAIYLPPGVN